jgi:hypothetical protein
MNTKQKQEYIKNETWLHDPYLVTPQGTTAVKRCKHCEIEYFTVDFGDDPRFVDHKLPVCTAGIKKGNGLALKILHDTGYKQRCKSCAELLTIDNFTVDMATNKLRVVCRTCQKPAKPLSEDF